MQNKNNNYKITSQYGEDFILISDGNNNEKNNRNDLGYSSKDYNITEDGKIMPNFNDNNKINNNDKINDNNKINDNILNNKSDIDIAKENIDNQKNILNNQYNEIYNYQLEIQKNIDNLLKNKNNELNKITDKIFNYSIGEDKIFTELVNQIKNTPDINELSQQITNKYINAMKEIENKMYEEFNNSKEMYLDLTSTLNELGLNNGLSQSEILNNTINNLYENNKIFSNNFDIIQKQIQNDINEILKQNEDKINKYYNLIKIYDESKNNLIDIKNYKANYYDSTIKQLEIQKKQLDNIMKDISKEIENKTKQSQKLILAKEKIKRLSGNNNLLIVYNESDFNRDITDLKNIYNDLVNRGADDKTIKLLSNQINKLETLKQEKNKIDTIINNNIKSYLDDIKKGIISKEQIANKLINDLNKGNNNLIDENTKQQLYNYVLNKIDYNLAGKLKNNTEQYGKGLLSTSLIKYNTPEDFANELKNNLANNNLGFYKQLTNINTAIGKLDKNEIEELKKYINGLDGDLEKVAKKIDYGKEYADLPQGIKDILKIQYAKKYNDEMGIWGKILDKNDLEDFFNDLKIDNKAFLKVIIDKINNNEIKNEKDMDNYIYNLYKNFINSKHSDYEGDLEDLAKELNISKEGIKNYLLEYEL